MIFWIIVIVGLVFGYMGLKKGFYVMFATLFNLMFAVFIAILSTPTIVQNTPGYENNGFYAAGSILLMFILVFGFLQVVCWFYLLRGCEYYFPEILEKVGSPILGFLCGYVITSVIVFSISIMPIKPESMPMVGTCENLQRLSRPGITKVCDFLGQYSLECFYGEVEDTLDSLIHINEPKVEEPVLMYVPEEKADKRVETPAD